MGRSIVEKGTGVVAEMKYTDASTGEASNPATVTVKVRKPDGTVVNLTPTSSVVGTWKATVTTDQEGTWFVRFITTDPAQVDTLTFDVKLDPDF